MVRKGLGFARVGGLNRGSRPDPTEGRPHGAEHLAGAVGSAGERTQGAPSGNGGGRAK